MQRLPKQRAILLSLESDPAGFLVLSATFAGLPHGERIELSFVETDATPDARIRPERVLGTASGTLVQEHEARRLYFVPDEPPVLSEVKGPSVGFRFESPEGISNYIFQLSAERFYDDEGDAWEVRVRADSHGIESPAIPMGRVRRQLEGGGATYDWHAGHELALYNDASVDALGSAGAFCDLLAAIKAAKHFVFVVDWSFQPLFCPSRLAPLHRKGSIGALLLEQAHTQPSLLVAIHTWNHTAAGAADSPNDAGDGTLRRLAFDCGLAQRPKNLLWRASSRTGSGWSHHQKFVVLDAPGPGGRRELKVFWGGLDLTKGRFDWPGHAIAPDDPEAAAFRKELFTADREESTDDWYNLEFADREDRRALPRQPWHDIHGALSGPAAWDFVREFVGRWNVAPSTGGDAGDLGSEQVEAVWKLFRKLYAERETFMQQYEGLRPGKWSAQVYRSLTLEHWAPPEREPKDPLDRQLYALLRTDQAEDIEKSILLAYRHNIARAQRFIYIENQYFMGASAQWGRAENDLPAHLVDRILKRAEAKAPFHVYIVMPMFPEGDPQAGDNREVRLNQWLTMQRMVQELYRELKNNWDKYLSFYFLANWRKLAPSQHSKSSDRAERVRAHMRYMVYVHSKLMLMDDRYMLFGSCNLNDRGLTGGGDSEIACGTWPSHGEERVTVEIKRFRKRLWLEHFGALPSGSDSPESAACVSAVQRHADRNYLNFRSMAAPPQGHICRLPLVLSKGELALAEYKLRPIDRLTAPDSAYLPDAPKQSRTWQWGSDGSFWVRGTGWAK
jgi:phospholipase D1/2